MLVTKSNPKSKQLKISLVSVEDGITALGFRKMAAFARSIRMIPLMYMALRYRDDEPSLIVKKFFDVVTIFFLISVLSKLFNF